MRRGLAVLMSVLLVSTWYQQPISGSSKSISDLQKEQQQIADEIRSTQSQINTANSVINHVQAEIVTLDEELALALYDLDLIEQSLAETLVLLAQTETELAQAQADRDEQFETLKARLRVMHEYGPSAGLLEVLLQATSFNDFLTRLDYVNSVAKYDQERLERLQDAEQLVSDKLDEVVVQKNSVEALQFTQTLKTQELETMLDKKFAFMEAMNESLEQHEAILEQQASDEARIKAALQKAQREEEERQRAAAAAAQRAAVQYNGVMLWPVPSYVKITSLYGSRPHPIYKTVGFHSGVDISAPMGSNILAADAGTVIVSSYQGSYGYAVVIDHGGGISTLYGHCSKLLVSVGQKVNKGDVIAKIGSTGVSTGPHCHFEVRINGERTDPQPYLGY